MGLGWILNVSAAVAILAVAAGTLLLFMAGSFLRREKVTTPSDDPEEDMLCCGEEDEEDHEDTVLSHRGKQKNLGDIFLSHSGRQKNFTEHLYVALRRANHTVFLDTHALPKADDFPINIKKALSGCKLGVLVLSEDFLTSKWPMVELEILSENGTKVLPLFYMSNAADLKSPANISRWRKKWDTMAKDQQQAEQWANAVKKLHKVNGIVYKPQESEIAYIKEVVTKICGVIPPHPIYDQSNIQGRPALAKEIAGYFDKLDNANQPKKARVVGLHGIGGQGKTTLCKTMVNFFNSKYLGRSSYIEFPTDCDQRKVVEECKKAMKQLFHLGEESLKVDDFDQVVQLMKQNVEDLDVFLGIDNIWEHSIEKACRLLNAGFNANSKVLLTSRSQGVLQKILSGGAYYYRIYSLPAPNDEDAIQIFEQSGGFSSSPFRNEIKHVLCGCRPGGKYHPLALKALGVSASRLCGFRNTPDWPSVLRTLRSANLQEVDDAIRFNYKGLDEVHKHMFLDIVFWLKLRLPGVGLSRATHIDAYWWLHIFYRELGKPEIDAHIYDLAMAGVIDIDEKEDIKVHDMYKDLAQKEAAGSGRFLTSMKEAVKGKEWGNLKRVILQKPEETVELRQCGEVEFLYASDFKKEDKIYPESMPSLRVLILQSKWAEQKELNLKELVHLEYLELERYCSDLTFGGENALQNLRMLILCDCKSLEDVAYLRCATQLQALCIQRCPALKRLPYLGGLTGLKELNLSGNLSLEEVGCLSPALTVLHVTDCPALKTIPELGGLTGLETLKLSSNKSLEEIGCVSPALKSMDVSFCTHLKRIADLGGLTGLDRLVLACNRSLEEVRDLGHLIIKELIIVDCRKLAALNVLKLWGRGRTSEMWQGSFDFAGRSILEYLRVEEFGAVRTLNVEDFTKLRRLEVAKCEALEEIEGLDKLPHLNQLVLSDCGRLQDTSGHLKALCQSRHWRTLSISGCSCLGVQGFG